MPGTYTHTTRASGSILTATLYNGDHEKHITYNTPGGCDDYSTNVSQMQSVVDPGEVGTESLPTDLAGELQRIRKLIVEITGKSYWYESPAHTLATLLTPADTLFRVLGSGDATKKLAHEVDGVTTGTTRTRFVVDEDASDGQSWEVKNLTLVATVGANALTVAVKTKNGTDPSATDPIIFKFRNSTVGTGDYTTVALTAALSLVISSGSSLGTVSGAAHRLYLGIANDAGTLRLFLYNPYSLLVLIGLDEGQVYSSTAEGGAGAADAALTLYSGTAFTSNAIRLLGYVESTQATAGTWATTPSKIHLLKQGDRLTGDVVQVRRAISGAVATGTTVLPIDDTIPQITEGVQFMSQTLTPTSAINLLRIQHAGAYAHSSATPTSLVAAVFKDSVADAVAVQIGGRSAGANAACQIVLHHVMVAGTVAAIAFTLRAGSATAGTITFNGDSGARNFGGLLSSLFAIEEIFV